MGKMSSPAALRKRRESSHSASEWYIMYLSKLAEHIRSKDALRKKISDKKIPAEEARELFREWNGRLQYLKDQVKDSRNTLHVQNHLLVYECDKFVSA